MLIVRVQFQADFRKGDCAMADVKDQAKDKIEEGTSWAKKAVDAVADKAGDVSSSVGDQAKQAVGKAQEAYQQVAEQGQEVFRHADAAVQENPHLSVGAGLGAGVVVGILIGLALGSGRS
jgi:ElaB/YqjD/DUF883 family membrane-anchored ribosome-binding protein